MKIVTKIIAVVVSIAVVACLVWGAFHFYYVFGEGVKAGELNFVVYKGYVFKTYEGRLILAGYNSNNSNATIQSNEFNFSVRDKKIADTLMRCTGRHVELYYKEYFGALPWRGKSRYVVDSIVSIQTPVNTNAFPLY